MSNYLSIAHASCANLITGPGNDLSASCWVKFASFPSSTRPLMGKIGNWWFTLESSGSQTLQLTVKSFEDDIWRFNTATSDTLSGSISLGVWYWFGFQMTVSTGAVTFWKDGAQWGAGKTIANTPVFANQGTDPFAIGYYGGTTYADAQFDQCHVWRQSSGLSLPDYYQTKLDGSESNLHGCWQFDSGDATDLSPNGYDLTVNGSVTYPDDVPF